MPALRLEDPPPASPLALADAVADALLALADLTAASFDLQALQRSRLSVLADRRYLAQALEPVLRYAAATAPRGEVLPLTCDSADGDVRLRVRQPGAARTATQRAGVFGASGEALAPTSPSAAGADDSVALALALARRRLQLLGGELKATADDDGATWLEISLPQAEAPSELPAVHVLCVEDNPLNLMLVRELLALRPQLRLRSAVDGESGIRAALADPPDLLLLDLQLPDIDGLQVMQRLRREPALAHCRIVALSADSAPENVRAALAAGFDAFWPKPIQYERFLGDLDRMTALLQRAAATG